MTRPCDGAIYESVFECAPDAVLVVDRHGHIARANQAAERMFGWCREELEGRSIGVLVPPEHAERHDEQCAAFLAEPATRAMGAGLKLAARHKDGREIPVDIMLSTVDPGDGRYAIAVVRDISDRRHAEDEQARLIAELKDALAHIRLLSGLLPICMHCKRIRAATGEWEAVEVYVRDHSEADFTHGICPACFARLYGEG